MRFSRNRLSRDRWVGGLLAILVLAGCSTTDNFEQPLPVPEIDDSVEVDTVWSRYVGEGHDGEFLYLAPLNTGDVIYAASADGELVAVNAEDGHRLWDRQLDERIFAGVGGDGNRLYLVTRDADLLALSREDGTELWRAALPTESLVAPQSNGRAVIIQTTDGRVLAFDADKGEKLWQYDGVVPVLTMRAVAAPLVGADIVIASFPSGKLIALSADSGQPLWQYEVGQPKGRTELERLVDIAGQPLVVESALLVVGYQGKLALVDIRTGQEIWNRKASSLYSPMVGGDNIYLTLANGDITALRGSDRRELWIQDQLQWRQVTGPMVYGDYLVVADYEGYLHVLTQADGRLVGQKEIDDEGIRVPVQRLGNGNLLVFGNGGKLAAIAIQPED